MGGDTRPVALVTGANTGIGKETARQLVGKGFHVIIACRSLETASAAAADISQPANAASGSVEVGPRLDLACQESVRSFASAFQARHRRLDVLVNNAGANTSLQWKVDDGINGMVNYLGPFLLTRLLERQLANCSARVVNVSSVMHRAPQPLDVRKFFFESKHGTYSATKLANVMFSNELQRRSRGRLQVCSVDPGAVSSEIWRNSIFARPGFSHVLNLLFAPPAEGCSAVVHAATTAWPPGRPHGKRDAAEDDAARSKAVFFARGLFASPVVTTHGVNNVLTRTVRATVGSAAAIFDQPIRVLLRGHLGTAATVPVESSEAADSPQLCAALWDESCRLTGVRTAMSV